MNNKITPCLWFKTADGKAAVVIDYYKNIFGADFETEFVAPLGDTPSGNCEMCGIKLYGLNYHFLVTEKEHHAFNDAISLSINCADQAEIDKFWNYFTKEGKESQCGWCNDKFGLRWQVVPQNMGELMSKPNAGEVMMKQKKIVIAEYLK